MSEQRMTPIQALAAILRKAQGQITDAGEQIDVGYEVGVLLRHFDELRERIAELERALRLIE